MFALSDLTVKDFACASCSTLAMGTDAQPVNSDTTTSRTNNANLLRISNPPRKNKVTLHIGHIEDGAPSSILSRHSVDPLHLATQLGWYVLDEHDGNAAISSCIVVRNLAKQG